MSAAKTFIIKESEKEIKLLIKKSDPMIAKRLQALLVFKRNETTGLSKRFVADEIGVNHNSVQTWRSLYITGGIELFTSHLNIGYKTNKINIEQEQALRDKLHDPYNGIVGFVELLDWFNSTYKTAINYKTFHGFIVRKFNAKVKVARKSHVNKVSEDGEIFKKTSLKSVKKLSLKKDKDMKK